MNDSLFTLAAEEAEVLRMVEEAHGELTPELAERLDELGAALSEKADAYGYLHTRFKARIEECKGLEQLIKAKRQAAENALARLHKRALETIKVGEKREGSLFSLRACQGKGRAEVYRLDALPKEYLRTRDPEPDKTKIREALVKGETVPGARLAPSEPYLQVK